jgi:hypothetical protein
MMHSAGRGFWVKLALAATSAALLAVTLLWHDWIEILFRVDPDHGNGWLEWLIVVAAFSLMVTFSIGARQEWRRSASVTVAGGGAS